jgi:CBS domain-containing protein
VQLGELERILADATVHDAMIPEPVTVAASSTLQEFIDHTYARSRHTAYPVLSAGTVVGEITFRAVAAVPAAAWPQRLVSDVMLPLREVYIVAEDAPLFPAVVELMTRPPNRALVADDGRLAGLLSITDVSRLLELRRLTQR